MDFVKRFGNNYEVTSILLGDESSISGSEVNALVDHALDNILQKQGNRVESFQVLAQYCSRHSYARLGAIVDRLPTLLEVVLGNVLERNALLELLESLFLEYTSEVSVQLPKVLTKLVSSICRIVSNNDVGVSQFGLRIFQILGESKARPILVPHTRVIRNACLNVLSELKDINASQINLLAQVYGVYSSLESVDNWMANWNDVVIESGVVISVLGVGASKSSHGKKNKDKNAQAKAVSSETRFTLLKNSKLESMRGAQKALHGQALFHGMCRIQAEMLRYGCSSGFVALNFTQFLPTLQTLLSASAEVNTKDPVSFIEGDAGLSPVDLVLVISKLKADLLEVVQEVFLLDHPALIRIGSALVRPVAALMTRPEGKNVPHLRQALLTVVASAARALPSVLAASVNATNIGLVEQLSKEMAQLTSNQSLVSQSAAQSEVKEQTNSNGLGANKDGNLSFATGVSSTIVANLTGTVITHTSGNMYATTQVVQREEDRHVALKALFEACEAVLLHCGPMLSPTVRESFATVVGQGLSCLSLGVLTPQYADRHMHRIAGARLRQDPFTQNLLIQLATVEVFSPPQLQHQAQQYSRNLPLLKRVAEVCLRCSATTSAASRALLLYSTLLHPVTVALPAVPAIDAARSFLLSAQNSALVTPGHGDAAHGNMQIGISTSAEETVSFAVDFEPTSAVKESKSATKAKRSLASAEVTPAKKPKTVAEKKALSATKAPVVAPVSATKAPSLVSAVSVVKEVLKNAAEEDDDESLPDIDIDADPDSE